MSKGDYDDEATGLFAVLRSDKCFGVRKSSQGFTRMPLMYYEYKVP